MSTLTAPSTRNDLRGHWCDPYAYVGRAWQRPGGRVLLSVQSTSISTGAEDIGDDAIRFFASRGLRIEHVSSRESACLHSRRFWVLAAPVAA